MNLLLLNTSSENSYLAIASGASDLLVRTLPGRGSSEQILPTLRAELREAHLTPSQLTAVASVTGPGSFTGTRVSLSIAKGLCDALTIPLIAISRFALIAEAAWHEHPTAEHLTIFLDAGRSDFYCGIYTKSGLNTEQWLSQSDAPALCASAEYPITTDVAVQQSLGIALLDEPNPYFLKELACRKACRHEWADIAATDATYLERTNANG